MHRRIVLKGLAAGMSVAGLGGLAFPASGAPGAVGRWLRLESRNFVVYSSVGEAESRTEIAALEGFHAVLWKFIRRPYQPNAMKLNIYLAGGPRDFELTWPGVDSSVAGFYSANVEEVRAIASLKSADERQKLRSDVRAFDARTLTFHEYAHHFMLANQRFAFPPWYVEGFAEFVSTADFSKKGVILGKYTSNRADWLNYGEWMDVEVMLGVHPGRMSDEATAQFYAQSWLATHYIHNTPERFLGLGRYVSALEKGEDPVAAFPDAFGVSTRDFEKELRAYKKKQLSFFLFADAAVDTAAEVTVTRMPPSADELLPACNFIRSGPPAEEAAGSVALIRATAARFPGDAFAEHALALVDVWYGDLAVARVRLDALLAGASTTAETHHLSGLCDLRMGYDADDDGEALFMRAQASFEAAARIEPTRAASLFRQAECRMMTSNDVDAGTLELLVQAYTLAPQVGSIGMMTAQALMEHGRFEEATIVLAPIAGDPHGGGMTEIARGMLEAAHEGKEAQPMLFGSASTVG